MNSNKGEKEIMLRIDGTDCRCRVEDVKRALCEVPGVISALSDDDGSVFVVRTAEGGDAAALITAVHAAGFDARTI